MGSVTDATFESRRPQGLPSPLSCFSLGDVAFAATTLKLGSVRKVLRRRLGKAKQPRKRSLRVVDEHSEAVFNAASPSIKTFRTEPS